MVIYTFFALLFNSHSFSNYSIDQESVVPNVFDPIVVYCAAGPRSVLVSDVLQKMGYKSVRYLEGGIKGWKDFGGSVDENYGVYSVYDNEVND